MDEHVCFSCYNTYSEVYATTRGSKQSFCLKLHLLTNKHQHIQKVEKKNKPFYNILILCVNLEMEFKEINLHKVYDRML